MGGDDGAGSGDPNDVWSSPDGVNWVQDTAAAQFERRTMHALLPYENELWLIGGYNLTRFNDVWRSADGVNWRVGFSHVITGQ